MGLTDNTARFSKPLHRSHRCNLPLAANWVAALALVAVLAGCGAGKVTRITESALPPSTPEPWVRDSAFILALDKEGIPYGSESGIIDMAHFIWDDLRTHPDRTSTDVAMLIMKTSPYGAADAGFLAGAAVNVYCPEYNSR